MNLTFDSNETEDYDDDDYDDGGARIVGGFRATEPVPWFSLLKIDSRNPDFPGSGQRCGGALITSKYYIIPFVEILTILVSIFLTFSHEKWGEGEGRVKRGRR